MTLLFGATAIAVLAMAAVTLWHLHWVRRLPSLEDIAPAAPENEEPVRCSAVIAARDEEARIEQTVRRLLAQRGVELQIIVVDDRSHDQTGQILQSLMKEDARIHMKRVDVLPEGWLGKCHACHLGATAATGNWILFTDADCWHKPDVLARALRVAARDQADHVTIASGFATKSFGLRACHLLFLLSLADWFSRVNRDKPKRSIGIGAFNLVRTAAYRACGGYEALRLTVVDDVKLGLLLRRAGKRTRAFIGGDEVECHWGTNLWDMIKVFEKNYFAALDFRTGLVIAGTATVSIIAGILAFGALSGTSAGLTAAFSPLSLILPGVLLTRRLNWPWLSAVGLPFMIPVFVFALLNSTYVTLRHGGIRWRDTFYAIDTLRAGGVK